MTLWRLHLNQGRHSRCRVPVLTAMPTPFGPYPRSSRDPGNSPAGAWKQRLAHRLQYRLIWVQVRWHMVQAHSLPTRHADPLLPHDCGNNGCRWHQKAKPYFRSPAATAPPGCCSQPLPEAAQRQMNQPDVPRRFTACIRGVPASL